MTCQWMPVLTDQLATLPMTLKANSCTVGLVLPDHSTSCVQSSASWPCLDKTGIQNSYFFKDLCVWGRPMCHEKEGTWTLPPKVCSVLCSTGPAQEPLRNTKSLLTHIHQNTTWSWTRSSTELETVMLGKHYIRQTKGFAFSFITFGFETIAKYLSFSEPQSPYLNKQTKKPPT